MQLGKAEARVKNDAFQFETHVMQDRAEQGDTGNMATLDIHS